tara:strand:+ start:1659 stop:3092 length:1434 start_codon:yes stop_codon:yes gene_type:complete
MVVKRRTRRNRQNRKTRSRLNRSRLNRSRLNRSRVSKRLQRARKKKYSRRKKSKKIKRNKKIQLGAATGGGLTLEEYIRDIIEKSNYTDEKIISYLTSSGVDYTGFSDKISPPLLSRLGDIQYEAFKSIGISFSEIFYSFVNLLKQYPDKLPSVYDAIVLDSKVHYMELLLENGLCDDSTIIIYNDINTGEKLPEKSSQKTQQNLELLKSETDTYYIKTPFAGSSSCSIKIESSGSSLEDLIQLIPESNFCIGRNYGLIIQKENPKFFNAVAGEIRCCCHEGNIKSISLTWGFKVLGVDKSVFMKLLEKNTEGIDIGDLSVEQLCGLILDNIVHKESLDIVPTKSLSEEDLFEEGCTEKQLISEHSSKLSDVCNKAYHLLKSGLHLDGSLYRIDLVRSRDSDDYIINEIENINFGEGTAEMLKHYEPNIKTLSEDELRDSVPQVEDILKLQSVLEICKPIINSINSLDLRQLLLLFD